MFEFLGTTLRRGERLIKKILVGFSITFGGGKEGEERRKEGKKKKREKKGQGGRGRALWCNSHLTLGTNSLLASSKSSSPISTLKSSSFA